MNRPVVLITGASSGIGFACAENFAAAGYQVYATARRPEPLQHLRDLGCTTVALDVTDEASIAGRGAHGRRRAWLDRRARQQRRVRPTGRTRGHATRPLSRAVRDQRLRRDPPVSAGASGHARQGLRAHRVGVEHGRAHHVPRRQRLPRVEVCARGHRRRLALRGGAFGIPVVLVEPGLVATSYGRRRWPTSPGPTPTARTPPSLQGYVARSRRAFVARSREPPPPTRWPRPSWPPPPTRHRRSRYVVGAMAEQLIGLRATAVRRAVGRDDDHDVPAAPAIAQRAGSGARPVASQSGFDQMSWFSPHAGAAAT